MAGYPKPGDPSIVKLDSLIPKTAQAWTIIGILTILVLYVTAVYGPIAAALVEFFPTRIRYTAMSLPYHIGNGWFGGLLPATALVVSGTSLALTCSLLCSSPATPADCANAPTLATRLAATLNSTSSSAGNILTVLSIGIFNCPFVYCCRAALSAPVFSIALV